MAQNWTQLPFPDALARLLKERRMSVRRLADLADVNHSHLSRVLAEKKVPTIGLIEDVADALELPQDYFVEVREEAVIEKMRSDPGYLDRQYRALLREMRRKP